MHDYSYSAHLVINDGYEDRLDITITCQNAQQLLRAKDLIADQMNAYIAEFAVQSGLTTGVPSNAEQNAAALQAVIQEQTEKAKQQEPEEPAEPEPPETAPDEPEESPPRTMMRSMPSATARISHHSNLYPPKLPKRQQHPQEQKA